MKDICAECGRLRHDVVYSYKYAQPLCLNCWEQTMNKWLDTRGGHVRE